MTLADYALATVYAVNGAAYIALVALALDRRRADQDRAPPPHARADAAAYPPGNLTPSARHRDEMIRQGLFS
jgi:hypothetical protein